MDRLIEHLRALPASMDAEVAEAARLHLLDTVAAAVSGMDLAPGEAALEHVRRSSGRGEARVVGRTGVRLPARPAALAGAMAAHADETDDSHEPSRTHPGCAVVPAVLAVAERDGATGRDLLAAVAGGYELCGRITPALWPDLEQRTVPAWSTHSVGSLFGALAGVGVLAGLDARAWRSLLAYGVQRSSGVRTYLRGEDHVEKAYVFAGMGASTAVEIAGFVASGWRGVPDALAGRHGLLEALGEGGGDPQALSRGLGERSVVGSTNIKRFPVGSPIQAPLQALLELAGQHGLGPADVTAVHARLPRTLAQVVTDRHMPSIDLAYCLTVAVLDGDVSFSAVHDQARFAAWRAAPRPFTVTIEPDDRMERRRQATVRLVLASGESVERHVDHVRGTAENPMTATEVEGKAEALLAGRLGATGARELVARSRELDGCPDAGIFIDLL